MVGGGKNASKKFNDRYNYLAPLPEKLKLPFIKLDSNLFDFYQHDWEFDAGIFCRATGVLVFQRQLSKYYISADNSYYEHMRFLFDLERTDLSSIAESFLHPMLSTEGLSIITDGIQYTRTQKTELIVDYWPTKEYLNVCVSSHDSVQNCTMCHKCLRTVFALDVMGRLQDFAHLFDLKEWDKRKFKYKCQLLHNYHHDVYAHDNIDYARSKDYPLPPGWLAMIVMLPTVISAFAKKSIRTVIGAERYRKLWHYAHGT